MKTNFFLVLAIVLFTGCDKVDPVSLPGCNDDMYGNAERFRTFKNVNAYVDTLSNATVYCIKEANSDVLWIPCNLPEEYKKSKLAIRISGNMLYFPGSETWNTIGIPVELTSIKER